MKKFNIPEIYKSNSIAKLKELRRVKDRLKKDFTPTVLDFGNVTILLARHFGFCYGVENAVEIAYKTIEENEGKRIFFLSEMIHNPEVNEDLLSRGVKFLMDTKGNQKIPWSELTPNDIVVVPAFGTTVEIQQQLESIGINPYKFDTTCPFVEKVWNRASQIGERGYTVVVHGKPSHEETRATFSHSKENTPTVVVYNMEEATRLALYIQGKKTNEEFFTEFEGQYSLGFDPSKDLQKIGVVNQTTMLASETQAISDYLKEVIVEHYNLSEEGSQLHFANTRDTLCYATNDNQDATQALLEVEADMAIVVGGYNSSNTQHLVELCEKKLKTFYIRSQNSLLSPDSIQHYDMHKGVELVSTNYLPRTENPKILLTCGASCPDAVMESVLLQILEFYNNIGKLDHVIEVLENS
ncbi:4-hydroxy-3-methylbut-2-enyl diphosphate reductase [Spirosomataceae bacterium TFI 002]|nr:4-hydroxy-3-methylbut-2-enyl diphosphate reductase [Spirosomataceae bacterium TFI 002]